MDGDLGGAEAVLAEAGVLGRTTRVAALIIFSSPAFRAPAKRNWPSGRLLSLQVPSGTALPVAHSSWKSCACMPSANTQNNNDSMYLVLLIMADLIIY